MPIDPVVVLVDELRSVEQALSKASKIYNRTRAGTDGDVVNRLLGRLKRLYGELFETVPTSALGSAELISIAALRLPFTYSRLAVQLHDISDRLSLGQRDHSDLVWLRAMHGALHDGLCGDGGKKMAPLLELAVRGIARPVLIFRSVRAPTGTAPWQDTLMARLH